MSTRTIRLVLEVDVSTMTESELSNAGFRETLEAGDQEDEGAPEDEFEDAPEPLDYPANDVVSGVTMILNLPENSGEILAGSNIFVSLGDFELISAEWKEA